MILHIFAEEVMAPPGFTTVLASLLFILVALDRFLSIRGRLTKLPPMDEQLSSLRTTLMEQQEANKDAIMARLDAQDAQEQQRIAALRAHFDGEMAKVHDRVSAHGEELFFLKGKVEGREGR